MHQIVKKPEELVEKSELILVCIPLESIPNVFQRIADSFLEPCLISDVAGVKLPTQAWAERYLPPKSYIGSHPMGGGLHGGFSHARADLFHHKATAVCPCPKTPPDKLELLLSFWRSIGAEPLQISPDTHDQTIASTSHLPYICALAQVKMLHAQSYPPPPLYGAGYLHATRHALFTTEIMATVASSNPKLPTTIRNLAHELELLASLLEDDPESFCAEANKARKQRIRLEQEVDSATAQQASGRTTEQHR